jgi:23S rRNA pseudouridine2605 synthase
MERLQKVLAHAGVASRRACETMISSGRVTVNGRVVTELGTQVDPETDILAVDGKAVTAAPPPVYVLLNKPAGYVSTTNDPEGRPTVLDLLKGTHGARLFPVGRLDLNSEGLLLLTNDGALTERLTHPRYELEKEYWVWVSGNPGEDALRRLRAGIPLDGKPAPVDSADILERPARTDQPTLLRIVVHEGRKREIRRLCELAGYPVRRLRRVRLGSIELGDLAPGRSRLLTRQEVASLEALTSPRRLHANHDKNTIHNNN